MKIQQVIIILNKSSLESWAYSALSQIIEDFDDLGKSKSSLQKCKFPIDLDKYRINKGILKKTEYIKTNHDKLNV